MKEGSGPQSKCD